MNTLQSKIVTDHRCLLGEGPVWDDQQKAILWIDILKGEIHEYNLEENIHTTLCVHELIGSVAICRHTNLVAAVKSGFVLIDRTTAKIKNIVNPEPVGSDNRFNEGKCDPVGRFLAGTMSLSKKPNQGSLYALERDHSVIRRISSLSVPNGMAWSIDYQTFYHIDTPTYKVVAYKYDCGTGAINNGRTVIEVPTDDGLPDGLTIDTEGMLWIAHWGGWQITRWDPATGQKLSQFSLPVAHVTSCTFGGDNLQDIYITSASANLTEEESKQQPLAGCLFVIKNCGFTGIQAFRFGG